MRDFLARRVSYPADREAVGEAVGDATIRSPRGTTTTVASVLKRTDPSQFDSVDHLHATLMAALPAAFVGRRRYDDRGGNPEREPGVAL